VSCGAGPFTYNGSPQTPCSVTVTGAGGLNETPTPTYSNNVNAGTATASYTYAESTNHLGSDDSETFVIAKAASTTTVSCTPGPFTYNGSPQTPCSVTVTGAGGLNDAPTPTYTDNVNAGTATASYTYAESANHLGSSDDETFVIAKASSTTVVTFEAGPYVYRATQFTSTAQVSGVGSLSQSVPVVYSGDCTNVTITNGCGATATFAGDSNHLGSDDTKSITITKRTLTITPAGEKVKTFGGVFTAFTGTVAGLQGADGGNATYASPGAPAAAAVGKYNITSGFAFTSGSATNYNVQAGTAVEGLWVQYLWDGFLQPINDTAHDQHTASLISKFKLGQTIPVKFDLKDANGNLVVQAGSPLFNRGLVSTGCALATEDEPATSLPADGMPIYTLNGGHYQYGWSTKGLAAGLYRIYANLADGTSQSVLICLNK